MGAVTSRQIINIIDCFVLSIARLVDRISRDINRKLSTLSSFFFSRVFGYDVVFAQDTCAHAHKSRVGEPLLCQANVCIVPASSLEQRQAERKRRSERRKRAEAAALGEAMLRKHIQAKNGSNSVESWRNSPVTEKRGGKIIMEEKEKVMINLGAVAKPSSPRPVEERETVAERERGKLWVMMVAKQHPY
uniref:Uncharacterized protein n=1 Tax=Melanopsichium pennsylvanicum 4 TaxID=1398559 RepID=A0A077R2Y3_9BASI|nr:putative protein [Melanopsichium pennsylvanicum 4]